jgi:hypothetical protein
MVVGVFVGSFVGGKTCDVEYRGVEKGEFPSPIISFDWVREPFLLVLDKYFCGVEWMSYC